MKNFFSLLFFFALLVVATTSCEDENQDLITPATPDEHAHDHNDHLAGPDHPEVHDALVKHIHQLTEDYSEAVRETVTRPDGTVETIYMVGGDIELTKEQLAEFQSMSEGEEKQYRTRNRVNSGTIKIMGAIGGSEGLTYNQRRGLRFAVDNYNALGLTIQLELEFDSKNWWNNLFADIVVYRAGNSSSASASAGFPSGGDPYKWGARLR